jgi:anti-sigma regulatory factor (Ser/Thr protein kinase)
MTLSIRVESSDQVGQARRQAAALAQSAGLDDSDAGRVALVATECASNLLKHAEGGELLLQTAGSFAFPGVELLSLDRGPGIADVGLAFQDGYSSAGSPGTGLGAIRRLSSFCELETGPGKGAALLARLWGRKGPPPDGALVAGGVSVPKPGQDACGDGWRIHQSKDFASVLVVDGLGHGPSAEQCAIAASEAFSEAWEGGPREILTAVDGALKATRGAAVATLRLDCQTREARFVGIGNIGAIIHHVGRSRHMVSYPGIAGHDTRHARELTYEWEPGALVLLYSDGITTRWSPEQYEGLLSKDPLLLAGVIYRDWNRGHDDATVVAIRERTSV